jgi:hypothetical protein
VRVALANGLGYRYSESRNAGRNCTMPTYTRDLFDDATLASPQAYLDAFESWVVAREHFGAIRERSSVAVYRSMWCALTAWCVSRGLRLDDLKPGDFEAYLHSRGGVDELTARHAWRLLMLADAVQHHRAAATGAVRNAAAHELLMATPDWRYANAADKTPLPDHLHAAEARHLVQWLLDPASATVAAGAPAHTWQALRNRAAVALQLGAGWPLTPGDSSGGDGGNGVAPVCRWTAWCARARALRGCPGRFDCRGAAALRRAKPPLRLGQADYSAPGWTRAARCRSAEPRSFRQLAAGALGARSRNTPPRRPCWRLRAWRTRRAAASSCVIRSRCVN